MTQSAVAHSHADKAGFNPAINGLRGLCALFVFAFHIFNAGIIAWPEETQWQAFGVFFAGTLRFGVEMFFMISGFVIVGSLLRHAALGRFYVDRFIRIYSLWLPLHLAICIAGPFVGWRVFNDGGFGHWLQLTLANLFLLPPLLPISPTHPASWSLSYEWLFYIGAGLVWWVSTQGPAYRRIAPWLAAALFLTATIAMPRSLFFLTGVVVYLARHKLPALQAWLRYPALSLLVFLLAWGATNASIATPFHESALWLQPINCLLAVIALIASIHMFACITARRAFMSRLLELPVFQFFGNISFSFYLVSGMTMFAVKKVTTVLLGDAASPMVLLILFGIGSLLLSSLASWITRTLFEQRFGNWMRERFSTQRATQRDAQSPTPLPVIARAPSIQSRATP